MEDQIFIQHRFRLIEGDLQFSDALIYPIEEYQKLTPEEIEKLKIGRFDVYKEYLANPPVVVEPPDEEKIATVIEEITKLLAYKAELEAKIGGN